MISEVEVLLKSAREHLINHDISKSESLYQKAINIINKKIPSVDFHLKLSLTMKLWTTKAELLYFRSTNPLGDETFEDCRNKRLDCLRYLYKCSKVNDYFYSVFHPRLMEYIKDTICRFGCILPEIDKNVVVTCPIYLRRLDKDSEIPFHSMGTSIAITYEKGICSICEKDMLDDDCEHVPGELYNGETCIMTVEDFEVDHLALVNHPKDPMAALFTNHSFSVSEALEKLPEQERARKIKYDLPFICFLCKDEKLDSSELTPEHFFKMQNLKIEIE
jgi:hypothetical protein